MNIESVLAEKTEDKDPELARNESDRQPYAKLSNS
jgi:hypothetical protein